MNEYKFYLTLIVLFGSLLIIIFTGAFGYMTDILEGIGQGAKNIMVIYNSERVVSSDSRQSKEGGVLMDSSTDSDPDISVLAFSTVTAMVTAYTSRVEETDDTPCISASGHNLCLTAGIWVNDDQEFFDDTQFIACPKRYPFKTIVEIPFRKVGERCNLMMEDCVDIMSDRRYICLDRMNSRYDGEERFDIYFGGPENRQKALNWGIQKKLIKIYEIPKSI